VGKPEAQTGGVSARFSAPHFSSKTSAGNAALAAEPSDDELSGEGAFYRPPTRRPASGRPNLGNVPFRDKKNPQLDDEDEPFLRSSRRVSVRRSILPRSRWGRIGFAIGALVLIGGLASLAYAVRNFAAHDPRFRIDSSDNIQILGNSEVTQAELLSVFGGDMGRNVFFVPLRQRRAELEHLPWVETVTVMRLLPNQLRLSVTERMPIAFVRDGSTIGLVDRDGVLLPMAPETLAAKHYSFPVITGITANDPPSTRAARMKIYQRFIAEIDSTAEKLSTQLREVDISDPEDVKAFVFSGGNELLLHFGDTDFLARWHNYRQHAAEWQAQYPRLASVDLRYERQVVLGMRKETLAEATPAQSAKAADTPASPTKPGAKSGAAAAGPATQPRPHTTARPNYPQPGGN
jgi:cell division protein FtsQ